MSTNVQERIQKLELDTIKAVTELQKDVQGLTREVVSLAKQIQRLTENYETIASHKEDVDELWKAIAALGKKGSIEKLLTALFTTIFISVTWFAIQQYLK